MDKVLLFTHGIDIDGYGCAVLAKLAWGDNVDVVFAENFDLDSQFRELWEQDKFSGYSKIFITDHCLTENLCQEVDCDGVLRRKIKVIDHHKMREGLQEKFNWILVCDQSGTKKECATSLFYDYLSYCKLLRKTVALDEFVELTRLQDTFLWEGAKNGEKANRLDVLSKLVGREKYVQLFAKRLARAKRFYLLPEEDDKIDGYLQNLENIINGYLAELKIVQVEGKNAGLVSILDEHKGDITRKVRKLPLAKQIDFLFMPILDRNSISLRNVNPDCDVSKIAQDFGGGGHFAAASIPKQNFDLSQFEENS